MTIWLPDLNGSSAPRYVAIAEALAADIRTGRLPPGARLPTHRDLAWRLGVTVGTVSRAYAEAERRGLVGGEIGRGTFVKAPEPTTERAGAGSEIIELGVNHSPIQSEPACFARALEAIARGPSLAALLSYQPHAGRAPERAAIAAWLARSGLAADPDNVVITDGCQHAIAVAVSALVRPGEALAAERLSYPGLKALAALLGVELVGVGIDEEGLVPDAFEAACRDSRVRAVYLVPTLQNPTGSIMPETRRAAIARIAARHDVTIIEDDVNGFLLEAPPPPIASYAPQHSVYIGSASKSLAAGLRIGWAYASSRKCERIAAAMRATTHMATPAMAEVMRRWVESGDADRLVAEKRTAAQRRRAIADRVLGQWHWKAHPRAFHLWLVLPEGWRAHEFAAAVRRRGVSVTPGAAFFVGEGTAPDAVRVCLGTPASEAELERGLETVASVLASAPTPYLSVV